MMSALPQKADIGIGRGMSASAKSGHMQCSRKVSYSIIWSARREKSAVRRWLNVRVVLSPRPNYKPCFGQHRLTACRLAVRNKPFRVDCQIVFRQVDDLFNIAIFLLRRNYARVGDNIVDILSPHGGRKSEITDLKRRGPVAKNTSPVFAHISIEID